MQNPILILLVILIVLSNCDSGNNDQCGDNPGIDPCHSLGTPDWVDGHKNSVPPMTSGPWHFPHFTESQVFNTVHILGLFDDIRMCKNQTT